MGRVAFVAGFCACGKTTFAGRLSAAARVVSFSKDTVKAVMGDTMGAAVYAEVCKLQNLSRLTENILRYAAEAFMAVGAPLILESNFRLDEAARYRGLLERYGYEPLTFVFYGDMGVVHRRFHERELTDERHFANRSAFTPLEEWGRVIEPLKGFDVGGRRVLVDSTDFAAVDFGALIDVGAEFLRGGEA